jgi:hypothetical protein
MFTFSAAKQIHSMRSSIYIMISSQHNMSTHTLVVTYYEGVNVTLYN